jgi:hypothetical protein
MAQEETRQTESKRSGMDLRGPRGRFIRVIPPETIAEIVRLRRTGEKVAVISLLLGVSQGTVRWACRKAGLKSAHGGSPYRGLLPSVGLSP